MSGRSSRRARAKTARALESEEQMEQIKTDWLQNLTNLVSRINNRFSAHFASLGFAGQVELHRGKHEYDFENYGVNILVKYRDTEPLQKLTPHHQVSQVRLVSLYVVSVFLPIPVNQFYGKRRCVLLTLKRPIC